MADEPITDIEDDDEIEEVVAPSVDNPDVDLLDRKDLDDPQSPNHPMTTPHRVDAEGDERAAAAKEGQRIHDEEIAAMKRGETVDVDAGDQPDVSGTPSEGAGANDDVEYVPPPAEDDKDDTQE